MSDGLIERFKKRQNEFRNSVTICGNDLINRLMKMSDEPIDLFKPQPPSEWDFSRMIIKTDPSRSLAMYLHNKLYDEAQERNKKKNKFIKKMIKDPPKGFFPLSEEWKK